MSDAIRTMGRIGGCDVWRVALDASPPARWQSTLSPAERARAARFVFAKDRARYEAAHGALRELLAARARQRAEHLDFVIGPFGKPALGNAPHLEFNLSHSQDLAVIAIGSERLGVDVEMRRPIDDMQLLSGAHFTAAEQQAIARLDGPSQTLAFLRCWTRKEACLKALGLGLSLDTRTLEVGIDHDDIADGPMSVEAGPYGLLTVQSFLIDNMAVVSLALAVRESVCETASLSESFA